MRPVASIKQRPTRLSRCFSYLPLSTQYVRRCARHGCSSTHHWRLADASDVLRTSGIIRLLEHGACVLLEYFHYRGHGESSAWGIPDFHSRVYPVLLRGERPIAAGTILGREPSDWPERCLDNPRSLAGLLRERLPAELRPLPRVHEHIQHPPELGTTTYSYVRWISLF
jgi:hypothetical protein